MSSIYHNIKFFKSQLALLGLTIVLCLGSCKKLVEVEPPVTNPTDATAYRSNATAAAVLTGIYIRMAESDAGMASGNRSISLLGGLSADELRNYSTDPLYVQFYSNAVSKNNVPFWAECYQHIFTTNAALEGLSASTGVTKPVKDQLMGEAYFLRAFFYFYLVNLFGDVPLHVVTDYKVTSVASRSAKDKIYEQITNDLQQAQSLLAEEYRAADNTSTAERVRPNKATASALLARVYLYRKDYSGAAQQAGSIIASIALYGLEPDLNNVFLNISREAIWQLQPVVPQSNTSDARYFVFNSTPGIFQPAALSSHLLSAFEPGDKRRDNWVGGFSENNETYYYPFKYKIADYGQPLSEYVMIFRLAEQYLIRAEAFAEQGNLDGAAQDLNTVRNRAGLADVHPASKEAMLVAIEHERQVELFTEWGHRWLDLKRTGRVASVMPVITAEKGGSWNASWAWFPIPQAEVQNNPNITQNQGY